LQVGPFYWAKHRTIFPAHHDSYVTYRKTAPIGGSRAVAVDQAGGTAWSRHRP
jgi:hypothetical protein